MAKRLGLFSLFFVLQFSFAAVLPPRLPRKVSLIIAGPGNTLTSIMGHVDLLFSYTDQYTTNDLMVGFGPPDNEKIEILRAMGWKKPFYPMTMWQSSLADRMREAHKIQRKFIQLVPLNLSIQERSKLAQLIDETFQKMGKIPYIAPSYNCSTLISELLSKSKGQKIESHLRHQPLKNIELYKEFGWVRAEYFYSPQDIEKIAQSKR